MKDNDMAKKTKDDIQAIKDDMKDIVKRVGHLKGEALNALYDNSDDILNSMSEMKDKMLGQGRSNLGNMYACIEKNPLKSALYCFGAGIVLTMLLRK